ncbi:MAG: BTAD domain-containing putative transcriptional regulator [Acidimicrobiales bacterium]
MTRGMLRVPARPPGRVRTLAASVAVVAIVVALPIVLEAVGGSPFDHLGVSELGSALLSHRTHDPSLVWHWLARGALIVAWLSWAWLTVCIVIELAAWPTGRAPRRLPASRTMQSFATCLVGTALALSAAARLSSSHERATATVSSTSPPHLSLDHPTSGAGDWMARPLDAGRPQVRDATAVPVIEDLAQVTRTWPPTACPPSAGAAHTRALGVNETVGEGMPAGDHISGDRGSEPGSHLVVRRDTLWSVAAERLGSSLRWRELASLNYGVLQPDGQRLTTRHWIRPGWVLRLPSERSEPPPVEFLSGGSGALGDGTGRIGSSHTTDGAKIPLRPERPLAPLGGGVVGAGVAEMLDRMRRAQQRHRRAGGFIRLPGPAERMMEARLRIGGGWSVCAEVDQLLAQLLSDGPPAVRERGGRRAGSGREVLGVVIGPEQLKVELVVDGAVRAGRSGPEPSAPVDVRAGGLPEGWWYEDGGRSLVHDRLGTAEGSPEPRPSGSNGALPTLVTAGTALEGAVMVNTEALGSLVVRGDPSRTEGVLRALALELATSFWSGRFDLVVVGFGSELERFERVSAVTDVPSLVQRLWLRRLRASEHLERAGFGTFAEARSLDPSSSWDPVVVVCGPDLPEPDVAELIEAGADPPTAGAVIASGEGLPGAHEVVLGGSDPRVALDVLASVLFAQQVGRAELDRVGALLDVATDRVSVLKVDEPYVDLPVRLPPSTSDGVGDGVGRPPDHPQLGEWAVPEIEVAVLGPVEVRGAQREFTRAWARELVVYLAMHPRGATNEAWATALWPDRLMAPSSLHSTASVARRALGRDEHGHDHLPRSHGRLALASSVGTDWDQFVHLSASDTVEGRRQALSLVRGRPFEGLRSADWPILEGIAPAIEASVVDTSERLAEAELADGDPRGAQWAARRGLLVSPYDERLYRLLLRAADLDGNPAGVESVMTELVRLVADDVEPFDSVHPSTMELYRALSRKPTSARRSAPAAGERVR